MSTYIINDYTGAIEGISELIGGIQAAKGHARTASEVQFCCQIDALMRALRERFKELPPPGTYTRVDEAQQ